MHKPGQLLTAFMDNLRGNHRALATYGARSVKKLQTLVDVAAKRGIKFIAPKNAKLDTDKPFFMEDLRPPYPVTVLEGTAFENNSVSVAIIAIDTGDYVELYFICHPHETFLEIVPDLGEWITSPLVCRLKYSDTPIVGPFEFDVKPFIRSLNTDAAATAKTLNPFLALYFAVCQTLANHNVETQDIEPDAKEARVRKIRGKAPLFTYKTLVIGAPKKRVIRRSGGTHASPRSHLRRGYYRTSKNGVRHWVRAAMVKGETPGFVHKDYLVEQQGALTP